MTEKPSVNQGIHMTVHGRQCLMEKMMAKSFTITAVSFQLPVSSFSLLNLHPPAQQHLVSDKVSILMTLTRYQLSANKTLWSIENGVLLSSLQLILMFVSCCISFLFLFGIFVNNKYSTKWNLSLKASNF